MRRTFCFAGLFTAVLASQTVADVSVRSYVRKDGTVVQPHMRSDPDGNFWNNWSTVGNVNPYTGVAGTRTSPSNQSSTLSRRDAVDNTSTRTMRSSLPPPAPQPTASSSNRNSSPSLPTGVTFENSAPPTQRNPATVRWTKDEIAADDLMKQANAAARRGDYALTRQIANSILRQYPTSMAADEIRSMMGR